MYCVFKQEDDSLSYIDFNNRTIVYIMKEAIFIIKVNNFFNNVTIFYDNDCIDNNDCVDKVTILTKKSCIYFGTILLMQFSSE